MDIDVTIATKQPQRWYDAAAALNVITQEDIRRSGAARLPDVLRLADNLQVAQKGPHDWGITARGFNTDLANKLLVMIDGRTVYTPLYSGVFWSRQDYLLADIDHIEVISGPGGSLWGANAVNGVINVLTKRAGDTQGVYVEGGGGTEVKYSLGARYGGSVGSGAHYRAYGKYFDGGSTLYADGNDAADAWRMAQGGLRFDIESSIQNDLTIQGDVYGNELHLSTGGIANEVGANVLGRWNHNFSGESDFTLQVYYDRTHLFDPVPALVLNGLEFAPAGILKDDLQTYDIDFQHRIRLCDNQRLIWGTGYRFTRDRVSNSPTIGFLPTVLDQGLFSAFVQDEITLFDDLSATVGTKVERNDYTGWEFEPNVRIAWTPLPKQLFWLAVSRAVRAPSRVDRDIIEPVPPNFVFPPNLPLLIGGSVFKSETVVAYELGYRAYWAPTLAFSLSTFYNVYNDIRSTSLSALTLFPLFFENNLKGETYGIELSADHQLIGWCRLHVGYGYLKEHIRTKPGKTDFNKALNETSDPEHRFSLRCSIDLLPNVEVDVALRWVDVLHNYNGQVAGSVPSYSDLDVRVCWVFIHGLELSVAGQNLLHSRHPEYGFPTSTRREIERSLYAKLGFSL